MGDISIIKGGTELDVAPGTVISRERRSPFFSIDEIPGEISFPFSLPPTDKNLKELQYIDNLPQLKTTRHAVNLKDAGMQITGGKLVTEFVQTNLQRNNVGSISAYTLSNASEFWQRIKDRKLKDLSLGGDRNFTWDGYNATTGTGFWKHCHDTWSYENCNDGDYVFHPIKNAGYLGNHTWMNKIKVVDGPPETVELDDTANARCLCPSIFMAYVLRSIFEEHGYKVSGNVFDDPQFLRAIMPSFYGVFWATSEFDSADPPNETVHPINSITIKLSEHVPPDWTISKYLIDLANKIPIGYEIDDNKKECVISYLNTITLNAAKDRSNQVAAGLKIVLDKEQSIYGFDNNFDGNDEHSKVVDLSLWTFKGEVFGGDSSSMLPGELVLGTANNEYWGIPTNIPFVPGLTMTRKIGDNIGGYKPANANNTIESGMSPMPSDYMVVASNGSYTVEAYVPICNQEGNWKGKEDELKTWEVRLLFWYGMRTSLSESIDTPIAHHHVFWYQGVQVGSWSWAYKIGDVGLYDVFWKDWLKTFANMENIEGIWYPELVEYLQFKWSDILLINNTPYLITDITDQLPMKGVPKVPFKARRMGKNTRIPVSTDGGTNEFIYLQLVWENVSDGYSNSWLGTALWDEGTCGNLVVYAWKDAAGTIPATPSNLPFKVQYINTWNGNADPAQQYVQTANGHRSVVFSEIGLIVNGEAGSRQTCHWLGVYLWAEGTLGTVYQLLPGTGYTVI